MILVREDWRTTSILYYVDGGRFHHVGADNAAAVRQRAATRVWLVGFEGLPTEEARAAVAGFRHGRAFEARESRVEEYERGTP